MDEKYAKEKRKYACWFTNRIKVRERRKGHKHAGNFDSFYSLPILLYKISFKVKDQQCVPVVDSWGKTADGVYQGHPFTGFYDECVTAASPQSKIKGKFCRIIL